MHDLIVFVADATGRLTYITPNVKEELGCTPQQILQERPMSYGRVTFAIVLDEERRRNSPRLTARMWGVEVAHCGDGHLVPMHVLAFFQRNGDGQLVQVLGAAFRPPPLLYLWHELPKAAQEAVVGMMETW